MKKQIKRSPDPFVNSCIKKTIKTGRITTVFSDAEAVPGVKPQGFIIRAK